ncbi:MAG: O-antigen ligase family protein [Crocinitomicaceae bacterium]|nr:O-antigen ligase family protein [Crocinitomicaceae bacterium]
MQIKLSVKIILYILLLTGLFMCPVFLSDLLIEPTLISRFTLLSVVLLGIVAALLVRQKKGFKLPLYLLVLFGAYYLVHLISAYWAINKAEAFFESQRVFLGICITLLTVLIFQSRKERFQFHFAFMVFGWIAGIACITDLILRNNTEHSIFFGHINIMSSFLFCAGLVLLIGFYSLKNSWRKISFRTGVALLILAVLIQTRSVLLAMLAFFIMGTGLVMIRNIKRKKIFLFAYLGLGLVAALILLFFPEIIPVTPHSLNERFGLWKNSIALIQDNPIQGVGAGNWQFNYGKYGVAHLEKTAFYNINFRRPHNDFLGILTETGLMGFTIFLCITGVVVIHFIQFIQNRTDKLVYYLFSGLTGIMVISFFSFPKERILHLALFSILLGLLLMKLFKKSTVRIKPKGVLFLLFVGLGFNAIIGTYRIKGEYHTKKAVEAQMRSDGRSAIDEGYKAISPFYITDPTGTPVYTYIGYGYNQKTILDSMLYTAEKAYELAPYDYKTLTNYGYVLQRHYQFKQAEKFYLDAYAINPNYEITLVNLSALDYNKGNYQKALEWLTKIENYQIKYPDTYQRLNDHLNN